MENSVTLFYIGPLGITTTVVTTWFIMFFLVAFSLFVTRHLKSDTPGIFQATLETIVTIIEDAINDVVPKHARLLVPFIGTLWIFIVIANLIGVVPQLHSPTSDISLTVALAVLTFLSVHWFGIKANGLRGYLSHYLSPSPILLPFHIISELSRTLALAVRLFGNMAGLEMAALLVLIVAGFLVPVPLLLLHVVEALIQAYIFGILALVYIAGGIQTQHTENKK